jgi:hypothetical protein
MYYSTANFLSPPACRVVGGQSRKMAKPIFGRGLAVRCERSEHGKSQLSKKYICTILITFLVIYSFKYTFRNSSFSLICQTTQNFQPYLTLFFRIPTALHCPKMTDNVPATWRQAGLSLTLAREQNFQICTNFRASYCPD